MGSRINGWEREKGLFIEWVASQWTELAVWLRERGESGQLNAKKKDFSNKIQQKRSPAMFWIKLVRKF